VRLWEVAGGREIVSTAAPAGSRVALSPSGKWLAVAATDDIQVLDGSGRTRTLGRRGHSDRVTALEFLDDDQHLVSAGERSIRVWDHISGKEVRTIRSAQKGLEEFGAVEFLRLANDRLVAHVTGSGLGSSLREIETGREICTLDWRSGEDMPVSADAVTLASRTRTGIAFREIATGNLIAGLPLGHAEPIAAFAFSPAGEVLASAGRDGSVLLWDWRRAVGLHRPATAEPDAQQMLNWWDDLTDEDSSRAYRAIGKLAASKGQVPFLSRQLKSVRAQKEEERPLDESRLSLTTVRQLRATLVLEEVGTAEARDLLATLAKSSSHHLGRAAAAALNRLSRKAEQSERESK
jgi:hypothetical protein